VRGRSQVASESTSLIVTGSMLMLSVASIALVCPFFVFVALYPYVSINVIESQYPLFDAPDTLMV